MSDTSDIDESALYRYIGERIRDVRAKLGITQAQLAKQTGVLRTSIANFEAGRQKAPLHVLYRLCIALGIETAGTLPPNVHVSRSTAVSVDVDGTVKQVPPKTADFLDQLMKG